GATVGFGAALEWDEQALTSTTSRSRERRMPPNVRHLESIDVERFVVTGGARLVGSVDVVGAKNSVLKLMAAALLAEGTTTLTNCPEILDVPLMANVLRSLGCGVTVERDVVAIDVPAQIGAEADYRSVSRLRASVCVLGPLIARCRRAVVPLPGGDAIGSPPPSQRRDRPRR